jgi:hypothetical protein
MFNGTGLNVTFKVKYINSIAFFGANFLVFFLRFSQFFFAQIWTMLRLPKNVDETLTVRLSA